LIGNFVGYFFYHKEVSDPIVVSAVAAVIDIMVEAVGEENTWQRLLENP
jgi:hypothetical protein